MLSMYGVNLYERMLDKTLCVDDTYVVVFEPQNVPFYFLTLLLLLEFPHCLVIYALAPLHSNLNLDSTRLRH